MKAIHHALAFFLFTIVYTFTILATTSVAAASSTTAKAAVSFVKSTCNSTTYPSLCNKVCLPYAPKIKGDLRKMAIYALKGTVEGSKNASKTLLKLSKDKKLKPSERLAIKDCMEENKDTLDEIKESITSLTGGMKNSSGYDDMKAKVYDIKTWISAALTDEDTCMDGLDEENVRSSVKDKIANATRSVSMLCSNSLSIIGLMQY